MKVRKAIKSIVALGAGAAMMGATMFSALGTADLADFPKPMFIGSEGAFNGVFVVGDAAEAADVLGIADVKAAMQAAAIKKVAIEGGESVTTVEGGFLVAASGNDLNLLEDLYSVASVADSGDLNTLGSGTFKNNKGTYTYDQYVVLPNSTEVMYTTNADRDVEDPGNFLKFVADDAAWTYRLSFPTGAASDIDASNDLDDFDNKKITLLGKEYNIVNSDYTGTLTLELMGGAVTDTLSEQETKTYTVDETEYEVTVDYISSTAARFTINSETTDLLETGDTYALDDGTEIGVKNILAQNVAGETGGDQVEFYFGATKLLLRDTSNSASATAAAAKAASTVQVGSETISDAFVDMVFSNTSTTEIALSQIDIGFAPGSAIYVGENERLSDEVATERGDDQWVALHKALNVDYQFADVDYGKTEEIKIKASGSSKLKVEFVNKDGQTCSQDMFYTDGTGIALRDGSTASQNVSFVEGDNVYDEGLFFVEKNSYSHVMRLKRIDTTDTQVELKDECSGDTQTVTYSSGTATFYMNGQAYVLNGIEDNYVVLNDITDDSDSQADLWTENGAQIVLHVLSPYAATSTENMSSYALGNGAITQKITINEAPTKTRDEIGSALDTINITATVSSNKISPSTIVATTVLGDETDFMLSLDSDDNKLMGQSKWGTIVEQDTTGDQDTVTITFNEDEAKPMVYLTTGATTQSEEISGAYTTEIVTIPVSSSKLASQVSGVGADNMIVVGGPCVNTISAELMGNPANCAEGFVAGKAKIKLFENSGKVAMLVAGYNADDTRRATTVIAQYADYESDLVGTEVEVTGTSLTDITVGTPSVMEETVETV